VHTFYVVNQVIKGPPLKGFKEVFSYYKTSDPPRLRTGAIMILQRFSTILERKKTFNYASYIHINLPLESLFIKKRHQNP
jgi:hypothetical protein